MVKHEDGSITFDSGTHISAPFDSATHISAQQVKNLKRLAYWHLTSIHGHPLGFDMYFFCNATLHAYQEDNTCGTVGCLVGHGPAAGIEPNRHETWLEYSMRVFLPASVMSVCDEWTWCFERHWRGVDNTPEGGAKRILWLLEHGLPGNWIDQMNGVAPLCYADWEPEIPEEYRVEKQDASVLEDGTDQQESVACVCASGMHEVRDEARSAGP